MTKISTKNKNLEKSLINSLIELGFTYQQSQIYLASLKLRSTTIMELSRVTGIKRTSLYSMILPLLDKGLIHKVKFGWKYRFEPENPSKIEELISARLNALRKSIPDFEKMFNSSVDRQEKVRTCENIAQVRNEYLKILDNHKSYKIIGNQSLWYNSDPEFFDLFISERARKGIAAQLIVEDSSSESDFISTHQSELNLKVKQIKVNLKSNIIILDDYIILHLFNPSSKLIIVESKSIINSFVTMYDIVWASLII